MENKKWIKDTALLFYQIFSVDYEDEGFLNKLLAGGGGNSTLCSTWMHLNGSFVKYRISKAAYELLLEKISEEDRTKVRLENETVYISKIIDKNYHGLFYNNAKGANNRKKVGKFFHFDHNPSNKKVLELLNSKIKKRESEENFINELASYIETVQTIDLITIYEDDKRTYADRQSKNGPLSSSERDELLETQFYALKYE